MYTAADRILGRLVKVTPSSKVVGDLALHLVGLNADPADFNENPQKYDIPDSVIGFLSGELGDPPGGWPEPFRTKALQGRTVKVRDVELSAEDSAALNVRFQDRAADPQPAALRRSHQGLPEERGVLRQPLGAGHPRLRAAPRAARLWRRPGRRGRDRGQHLHRHGRGHPAERRHARCSWTSTPSRTRWTRPARGGDHAAHEGDPARAPLRPPGRHDGRSTTIAARHGIPVLEDAAQAHGATLAGPPRRAPRPRRLLQLLPGKNLGAYGDAGMVTSNDEPFVARVRQIANHGAGTTTTTTSCSARTAGSTRCRRRSCG